MSEEQIPTQKVNIPEVPIHKPVPKDSPTEEAAIADDGTKSSKVMEQVVETPFSRPLRKTLDLPLERISSGDISAVESLAEGLVKGRKKELADEDVAKVQEITDEALKIATEMKRNIIASAANSRESLDESEIDKKLSEQMPHILYAVYTAYPTFADELTDEKRKAEFTQVYLETYERYARGATTREILQERSLVLLLKGIRQYRELFGNENYKDDIAVAKQCIEESLAALADPRIPLHMDMNGIAGNFVIAMQLEESGIRSRKKHKSVPTEINGLSKDTPKEIKDIYRMPRQKELERQRRDHALVEMAITLSMVHAGDDTRTQSLKEELQATMPAFVPELGTPLYADNLGNISVTKEEGFTKSWLVSGYDSLNNNIIVSEEGVLDPKYAVIGLKGDELGSRLESIVTPPREIRSQQRQKALEDARESITFKKSVKAVSSLEDLIALIEAVPLNSEVQIIDPVTLESHNKTHMIADIKRAVQEGKGFGRIPEEYGLRAKVRELAEPAIRRRELERITFEHYTQAIASVKTLEELNQVIDEGYAKGFTVESPDEHFYSDIERLKMRIKQYVEGTLPPDSRVVHTKDPLYTKVEELKKEHALRKVRAKLESFTL